MNIFGNIFKNPTIANTATPEQKVPSAAPAASVKTQKHRITGVSHYAKNIMKIATENPNYSLPAKQIILKKLIDENIYQYIFNPGNVELIPEPSNPYDPNAIKVLISGEHVGYIKAGSCSRVLKLIKENRIENIACRIHGGAFKCLSVCGDGGEYEMEKGKDSISIEITIFEQ